MSTLIPQELLELAISITIYTIKLILIPKRVENKCLMRLKMKMRKKMMKRMRIAKVNIMKISLPNPCLLICKLHPTNHRN